SFWRKMRLFSVLPLYYVGIVTLFCVLHTVESCNESVCASIVSKCMLIKACNCDMADIKNCACCKDCQKCLSKLYTECCSCIGLCKVPNAEENLLNTSSVEDLTDPLPDLFNVLTEEPDFEERWVSFSYPYHQDALIFKPDHGMLDLSSGSRDIDRLDDVTDPEQNCTVAFMSQCLSLRKCKVACQSMGAARYRWFHDHGCCQCIGSTCISYGKNSPHCLKCPDPDDQDDLNDDNLNNAVNDLPEDNDNDDDDNDNDLDDDDDDDDDILDDDKIDDVV
ncbi:hypothetical protein FSP39_002919, partial [Pinctada imbricata]